MAMNIQQLKAATAVALIGISGMAMAAPDPSTVPGREQRMDEALQNYRSANGTSMSMNSSSGTSYGSTDNRGTGRFARAENATKRGLHRAGDAIKRGAHKTGEAISHAGEKVKHAVGGDKAASSPSSTSTTY
jgi:hypothetical protein